MVNLGIVIFARVYSIRAEYSSRSTTGRPPHMPRKLTLNLDQSMQAGHLLSDIAENAVFFPINQLWISLP